MADLEPLLTEDGAASFLNISPGTLRNWRSKGAGPRVVKVGNAVRFAPADLREYVESRTRTTSAAPHRSSPTVVR
jgi:predicted DNA-binding transcriptional regulator AlpA